MRYKGIDIIASPLPGAEKMWTAMDGWDYFQVPPFSTRRAVKRYINAGGRGVSGEVVPGFIQHGSSWVREGRP